MYSVIKTVTRNGKQISEEMSEFVYDWNEAKELYQSWIKDRIKESKSSKKKVKYLGKGEFVTPNGFVIQYSIFLLTRIVPESEVE